MSNKKISALTGATTPLIGTELVPIVQSGATDSVTVSNLTEGRVVSVKSLIIAGGLGTTGSPAYTPVNFTGYLGNRTAVIRSYDQSGTTALGGGLEILVNSNMAADVVTLAAKMDAYGNVTLKTGNLVQGTAAKGINFTANTPAAGMTSQLLNWYEEGTWTPTDTSGAGLVFAVTYAKYTRIGRQVTANCYVKYPVNANTNTAFISIPHIVSDYIIGSAVATTGNVNSTISIGSTATTSFRTINATSVTNVSLSGADVLFSLTYFV